MFITFEGVDGSGKSTQLRFLSEHLELIGRKYIIVREPGTTEVGEKIRDILLDRNNTAMSPVTEAMLYAAARVQLIDEVIKPALDKGVTVLCDRYIDSSVAYQAFGRGLGVDAVLKMNDYAVKNCLPDITFFIDVSPEAAGERMHSRTDLDRLELESLAFKDRVYQGFLYMAEREPERIIRIDASGSKQETREKILSHIGRITS
ncbi:MAG: dTMP kinase [Christensenellaceae bacterium]|nr:dTMP kinase [Christensenellaceae bacterium]